MTYPLSESFDDPRGRWNQFAPWDGSMRSDAVKAFLTTQEHVDLRNFRVFTETIPVPQNPDLDLVAQTVLDATPQTQLETKPGVALVDEAWGKTGNGFNAMAVGKIAARGGWSGITMTTSGVAISTTLTSSIAEEIDILSMDNLSLIFPDFNTFDGASYVQLTSEAGGVFTTASYQSAQALFSSNGSVMPQLRLALSLFTAGAGANFSLSKVTGIKIVLTKAAAPAGGLAFTLLAIRAFKNAWTESALDFDTRLGGICVPVTLDGAPYGGTTAQNFEFVRGDGTKLDPIPTDGGYNMYFYPGGATSPNDATGASYNVIAFLLREIKNVGAGTGSFIEARLKFNDTATTFEAQRTDTTGGSPGTQTSTTLNSTAVGSALDPTKHYLFRVEIKGTRLTASLYETTIQRVIVSTIWKLTTMLSSDDFIYRNGRVGFRSNLLSRDAYVTAIDVAPTGFAVLRTKVYRSRTPVDGARLAAIYSADMNLFSSVTGADLFIDPTKTISGNGSYRTAQGLTTNEFIMDDWTQTYLNLGIWVPNNVSVTNQPRILLNTPSGPQKLVVPKLQPAQWNRLHFDLGIFRHLLTGIAYSISVLPAPEPDKPLGQFWIDQIMIGRRKVAWSLRTTLNGQFREFADQVNQPDGAIHFTPDERGSYLQLRAEALTEDAWASSFKLIPRYAELGLPVYDQGFETR